ncbi:pyridoxal phosphate-dependent aminotransferase [Streptomyces sp. NPDC093085]|uniref:pyridoxal phosphate-dependent aminotransferase n=1 Tax=Streptomyces sp. NPDC093085 TaxID=3155068 RepID=UPI00343489B6
MNPYSYKWQMYPGLIPLCHGDMDFDSDPKVIEAVLSRLSWPLTYPPPYRVSGVATTLSHYYRDAHGLTVPEDAFWLGAGCLSQSYQVFASLLSPGDEVLYWKPAFKHVPGAVEAAGGIPVPVPAVDRELVREDLERLRGPATRAVYLVNPHNPTGKVFTTAELCTVSEFAAAHNLVVVSNELHARLVWEGGHTPFATVDEAAPQLSITLSGASKSHNLAGIGGAFAFSLNRMLLESVCRPAMHLCPEATSVQQAALAAAYGGDSPWLRETRGRLRSARDYVCRELRTKLPGVVLSPPQGTYFLWVDFQSCLRPGENAAEVLRRDCGVTSGAGPDFGGTASQARLSFTAQEDLLRQAVRQITDGLTDRLSGGGPAVDQPTLAAAQPTRTH